MGIKLRILLLVLLVVTSTSVSLGTLAFSRARQALEKFIGAALANAAVETLDKIDRELKERYEDIRQWARLDLVIRAAWSDVDADLKILRALDGIRKSYDYIPGILVTSSDGKVQAATEARLMGKPLPAELAGRKKEKPREVRFDGPKTLALTGSTALVIGAPVEVPEAEQPIGELLVLLDFAEVQNIIEAVRVTGEAAPWFLLLDSEGRAIALPGPLKEQWAGRLARPRELGLALDLEKLPGQSGFVIVTDADTGEPDLVGYARSRGKIGLGWTLLYKISSREAFGPVVALRAQVMQLGISLAALMLLLGGVTALGLVRPLERVVDAMERVRNGDFESKLTIQASGEIARLVEAFNFMLQGLKDREFIRDVFSRHVSPVVARKLLEERDALSLSGERRRATILFTDIRSFTTLSEQLPVPEVVALLNEYFTEMVAVVFRHDGFVNKFIGDALMAVWGAPYDVPDATARAATAALEMQARIEAISERRRARGLPAVVMGIGFTTGDVIAGKIGSPERMEYTVIGDEVNIASRIEGLTKQFGAPVMMSESSYREIEHRCVAEPLGEVKVKGRDQPITVYRLVSMTSRPESLEGHDPAR